MSSDKTSPRPWRASAEYAEDGHTIAEVMGAPGAPLRLTRIVADGAIITTHNGDADAELIVRAVNAHDELVAALQDTLVGGHHPLCPTRQIEGNYPCSPRCKRIVAALRKAGAK